MKNISLKLNEQILNDTEHVLEELKTSRNKYINDAIAYYNKYQKRRLLEKKFLLESKIVSQESMLVLAQFELLEDEI